MEQRQKMVKLSVEVRSGAARFRVGVQARSISQALGLVGGGYHRREVRGVSRIEAEGFFVQKPPALAEIAGSVQAHKAAA